MQRLRMRNCGISTGPVVAFRIAIPPLTAETALKRLFPWFLYSCVNGGDTARTGHGRTFNDDEGQGKVRSRAGQARSALERSQEHVRAFYLPASAQLFPFKRRARPGKVEV